MPAQPAARRSGSRPLAANLRKRHCGEKALEPALELLALVAAAVELALVAALAAALALCGKTRCCAYG